MSAWLAANRGDKQELCRELDSGAELEYRDPMGRTPLMEAAKHGHVECVHELLCRGADPTARSAVGWTASDFCGSHESQHGEINRLLGEAQMIWQETRERESMEREIRDKQQSQQPLLHLESNKENSHNQLQLELPGFSTPSPIPAGVQNMYRSYSSMDEPTQYRVEEPSLYRSDDLLQYRMQSQQQQQQHYQLQQQQSQQQKQQQTQQQQQQHLYRQRLLNPVISQGLLAQATLARLSQASEPAHSSLSSSMLSIRSSPDVSNLGSLSWELGMLPTGLHSPVAQHQQNPATLSKPVCRYWHSGRCLYGAHCRCASCCLRWQFCIPAPPAAVLSD